MQNFGININRRKTEGFETDEELNAKYGFTKVDCIRQNFQLLLFKTNFLDLGKTQCEPTWEIST